MIYMKLFYCSDFFFFFFAVPVVTIHFHCVEKNMIKTLLSISFYGRQKIENHLGLEQHKSKWQNSIFGWTIYSIQDEIKDFKEIKKTGLIQNGINVEQAVKRSSLAGT